jgi:hypothetical protein
MTKYEAISPSIRISWVKIILTPDMWRNWGEICNYIMDNFYGNYSAEMNNNNDGILYIQYKDDAIKFKLRW